MIEKFKRNRKAFVRIVNVAFPTLPMQVQPDTPPEFDSGGMHLLCYVHEVWRFSLIHGLLA